MSLLIAVDGSAGAAAAVRAAAALFPGARAVVLTAYSGSRISEQTAAAAARLGFEPGRFAMLAHAVEEQAAATAAEGAELASAAGLAAEARTFNGDSASAAILEAAREFDAAVVVCGTSGTGGLSRAVVGSTPSSLLYHADRPLLVVPEEPAESSGPLVVGYDGSEAADAAIAAAGRLLGERAALVVNVWESPLRHSRTSDVLRRVPVQDIREITDLLDQYFADTASETAERGAALAREHGLDAEPRTVETAATAWHGLEEAARSAGAAAIAVGSRGRGGVASALLGSVSAGLVHNADRPVLVVR